MKLITAIIQPDKLEHVREELTKAEVFRITVDRCAGRGRDQETDLYRGQAVIPELLPKVRVQVACNEEFVEPCIKAILQGARHGNGKVGDGKIFVTELQRCVRIRTGEEGSDAI